jgi:ATP-dependent DNA ligase
VKASAVLLEPMPVEALSDGLPDALRPKASDGNGGLSPPAGAVSFLPAAAYLSRMPSVAFEPCLPKRGTKVPAGPDWPHEIKHDGYRLIVVRDVTGISP